MKEEEGLITAAHLAVIVIRRHYTQQLARLAIKVIILTAKVAETIN